MLVETPAQLHVSIIEHEPNTEGPVEKPQEIRYQNVFVPPLPIITKKERRKNKIKKYHKANSNIRNEDESNSKSNSLMGQMLGLVNNLGGGSDDGPPLFETVIGVAKSIKSMTDTVKSVNKKIERKKLAVVQGYVSSSEMNDENISKIDPPLGPEARKNSEFEEQMQQVDPKPSLMDSLVKNAGPALLSAFANGVNDRDKGGPSVLENIFINVGPKIIADAFGGSGSGSRGSGADSGYFADGLSNALKFLTPFVKAVVVNQQGDNQDKGESDTAVSSLMSLAQGLLPLMQGGGDGQGGPRSLSDTVNILKPMMTFIGPSIMQKIVASKQNEQKLKREQRYEQKKFDIHRSAKYDSPAENEQKPTIIDKMLQGMDEKSVGQVFLLLFNILYYDK